MKLAAAIACLSALAQSVLAAVPTNGPPGLAHGHAEAKYFDRIFVIIMENEDIKSVITDSNYADFASRGRYLTNYHGVFHPSEPNYVAMIAGDTMGITNDDDYNLDGNSLVDLLEAKGISWKSYNQKYTQLDNQACNPASSIDTQCAYKRKHNPFISFNNIRTTSGPGSRCSKIVGASQTIGGAGDTLLADIKANNLAQFVYYVPEQCNDGHDAYPPSGLTKVKFSGNFLKDNFFGDGGYLSMLDGVDGSTLVVLTYDEGDKLPENDNTIYTVLLTYGTPIHDHGEPAHMMIHAGETCNARYDHYSMLRVIEDNWRLSNLGRHDVTATPLCTGPVDTCGC